eukprot:5938813-Prymnesium_polylepis.1
MVSRSGLATYPEIHYQLKRTVSREVPSCSRSSRLVWVPGEQLPIYVFARVPPRPVPVFRVPHTPVFLCGFPMRVPHKPQPARAPRNTCRSSKKLHII